MGYQGEAAPVGAHVDSASMPKAYFLLSFFFFLIIFLPSAVLGLKEVALNRLHVISALRELTEKRKVMS